jgi:hypothetical protein
MGKKGDRQRRSRWYRHCLGSRGGKAGVPAVSCGIIPALLCFDDIQSAVPEYTGTIAVAG